MEKEKDRQLNMEVLRIVAMLMIITLHYLDKGGILKDFALKMGVSDNLAWIIEALCMVSVNIYVLISGYFLSTSRFKVGKVITLWAQVLFYSWLITLIFGIVTHGAFNLENGIYDWIILLMPVTGNHYWFATIYILLYLLFPFLNKGIEAMEKKQFKNLLIVLTVIFSLWNSILPFTIPVTNGNGMDICWFVCLYMIAAYIRKYPEDFKLNKWVYLLIFFAAGIVTFLLAKGILLADMFTGKLGGYARNFYPYNSVLTLLGSVALFLFAKKCEINLPKALGKIVLFASQGTFGVYLIHEHKLLRYLWPKWFSTAEFSGRAMFIIHMIGTVCAVFAVGILIDFVRRLIFTPFLKIKKSEK